MSDMENQVVRETNSALFTVVVSHQQIPGKWLRHGKEIQVRSDFSKNLPDLQFRLHTF